MEQNGTRGQMKCTGVDIKSLLFAIPCLLMEKDYYKITEDGLGKRQRQVYTAEIRGKFGVARIPGNPGEARIP